ncbi:MAG: TlpA disulfide reductase family protein [Bacteroidota bacterium]
MLGTFLLPLVVSAQVKSSIVQGAKISGWLHTGKTDTLELTLHKEFSSRSGSLSNDTTLTLITTNGYFKFDIPPFENVKYFTLNTQFVPNTIYIDWVNHSLPEYFIYPGDSVVVDYDEVKQQISFSGNGSAKMTSLYQTRTNMNLYHGKLNKPQIHQDVEKWYPNQLEKMRLLNIQLDSEKEKLDSISMRRLEADFIIGYVSNRYMQMSLSNFGIPKISIENSEKAKALYAKFMHLQPFPELKMEAMISSPYFMNYIYFWLNTSMKYEAFLNGKTDESFYQYSKRMLTNDLVRERFAIWYMYDQLSSSSISPTLFDELEADVKDIRYRNIIAKVKNISGKGSQVISDMPFKDVNNKNIWLSDFKGKVLFLDFWFTGCYGCIKVAEAMPKLEAEFKGDENVKFISISIDQDLKKWKNSINPIKSGGYSHYTTPHALYLNTGGVGSKHSTIKRYNAFNRYPFLMLIGKDGRIYSESVPRPDDEKEMQKLIALIKQALSEK